MNKLLNIWVRRIHRWLVLPFIVLLLTVFLTRGTGTADMAQRFQAVFMIPLAITGAYLFILPYWAKWKRGKDKTANSR